MTKYTDNIERSENVVRLVNTKYVVDGIVSVEAFATSVGETYLSVNRQCIASFADDVSAFVRLHVEFRLQLDRGISCYGAMMNVGDVNDIVIVRGADKLDVSVEVEPRANHTKSHAGIFVRSNKTNIVRGRQMRSDTIPRGVSTDSILMEVQWSLQELADLVVLPA